MTTYPGNPFTALVRTIKDHGKRIKVAEQRIVAVETRMAKAQATLGTLTAAQVTALATLTAPQLTALAGLSAAQMTALTTFSASVLTDMSAIFDAQWVALAGLTAPQLTAMATITSSQYSTLGTTNIGFLSTLGLLGNQSNNNTDLPGVLAWSNNLTNHLISNGYMHS